LINTGWTGGAYGTGSRMKLKFTRAMITAALNGELNDAYKIMWFWNRNSTECPNVPSEILNQRNTWDNKDLYDQNS
jgi:phosphoenolpyruvate carboxykinase (ATP)